MDPLYPSGSRSGSDGDERRPGVTTPAPSPRPKRPPGTRRRRHTPQPLDLVNTNSNELVTKVWFLNAEGEWIWFPNALASPHWPQSAIPQRIAEALGHPIVDLPEHLLRTYATPRGDITSTRGTPLYIWLEGQPSPKMELLRILETEEYGHFGVSCIIGKPHIDQYYGQEWPPQPVQPQVVDPNVDVNTFVPGMEDPMVMDNPVIMDNPLMDDYDMMANGDLVNRWLTEDYPFEQ